MGPSRILQCGLTNLKQLISNPEQYPLFGDLQDENFRKVVEAIEPGSCVMEVVGTPEEHVPQGLAVAMWISKASVNLMVDKKERRVLSLRLWGEDLTVGSDGKEVKKSAKKEVATDAKEGSVEVEAEVEE